MENHMAGETEREGEEGSGERKGREREREREGERERARGQRGRQTLFNSLLLCTFLCYLSGEFWHEPTGRLFKGRFREGKFHGQGELLWFADSESRKKYIGEFRNGEMNGQGEMK